MLKQILQLKYLQSNIYSTASETLGGSVCFRACVYQKALDRPIYVMSRVYCRCPSWSVKQHVISGASWPIVDYAQNV